MYSFENDYDLYPANEGIGDAISDFFDRVWEKIQEFGEKVKEWAEYIKDRIKYAIEHVLKTREERTAESNKTMATLVTRIEKHIETIQIGSIDAINRVTQYVAAVKSTGVVHDTFAGNIKGNPDEELNRRMREAKNMSSRDESERKGIRAIDDNMDGAFSKKASEALKEAKKCISGDKFEAVLRDAKRDIGQLKGINDADVNALKAAHKAMLEIFGNNGKYGQQWRRIMAFQKLATGEIKTLIGKVVKIYNIGMKCTQALASKIVRGKFAADGDTAKERCAYKKDQKALNKGYDKDTKKERITSKNYKNDDGFLYNGEDQVKESAFMDMDAYQAGYEAAYEAAYRDAMESQEFYDSIPDAFEEFMSEQDDYGYDY